MAASKKQVEELQRAHDQKIKEQKIIEEKRKLMESQQKQVLQVMSWVVYCCRKSTVTVWKVR